MHDLLDRLFFAHRPRRARALFSAAAFSHRRRRKLRARIPPPHRTHTFAAMSNKVDAAQVTKAVAALRKHSEKVKAEGGSKLFDGDDDDAETYSCLLYTSPSPRDRTRSRMPSSA